MPAAHPAPAAGPPLLRNPAAADRDEPYADDLRRIVGLEGARDARSAISAWPGYAPTPLHDLPALAARLGVVSIRFKDEGGRFGLGAFKALGGAYAVLRLVQREVERRTGRRPATGELLEGAHRDLAAGLTVTCATAGNHGRSVAYGAELFGCRCVIFVPAEVSERRAAAIASHGAEVRRTEGGYDGTLRVARETARERGWTVVSDKSMGPDTEAVARDVMQGYTVMVEEALEAMAAEGPPTHAFVQAGVGGLAAAVCGHLWGRLGPERPTFVAVEAESADCLRRSAAAGRLTVVETPLATMMGGLACREPSPLAWRILRRGADFFIGVPDEASVEAMRTLASPEGDDPAVVAGESGAAGLAGLLVAARDEGRRAALGLDGRARVLLIGTEGATDPDIYRELVGRTPGEVMGPAG